MTLISNDFSTAPFNLIEEVDAATGAGPAAADQNTGEDVLGESLATELDWSGVSDAVETDPEADILQINAPVVLALSLGNNGMNPAAFEESNTELYALAEPEPETSQLAPLAGCSCMACQMNAENWAGGSGLNAPGPAVSLQALADYLRDTFWDDFDNQDIQYYNVTNTGTGANNGVLYYNMSGTAAGGVSTYYGTYTDTNGVTSARQTLINDAFNFYEELLGIQFIATTSTSTDVDFFFTDNDSGAYQAPRFYSGVGGAIDHSVININSNWEGGTSNDNDYTYQAILHEIGHALGLGHQGLYNGSGGYSGDALFANDSWAQSMMSYFSQTENTEFSDDSYAYLLGPSAADFIALNALYSGQGYGISNAFNGNTIYGVGTNITSAQNRQFSQLADFADDNFFTIVDGSGTDTVDFSNYSANQTINLTVTLTTDLRPTFSSVGGLSKNMALAAGTVIENATTGSGNDTLTGNQYANLLNAGDGNNFVYGGNGDDTLYGGAGVDSLYGGNNNDIVKGGGGADNLFGGANDDLIKGAGGDDILYAGAGVDTILGDVGNDRIVVNASSIMANASFNGGDDTDVFEVNGTGTWDLGNSTLTGFEEIEFYNNGSNSDKTVYITGAQAAALGATARIDGNNTSGSDDYLQITLSNSSNVLDMSAWIFQDWNNGGANNTDSVDVIGSEIGDSIIGGTAAYTLYAGDGDDSALGSSSNDVLKGGAGSDTLDGGAGNDQMYANNAFSSTDTGTNYFYAGSGNDSAYGGSNYDYFYGGAAASTSQFYGNDDTDTFYKASGTTLGTSESWYGGNGVDTLIWTNAAIDATRVVNLATGFITSGGNNHDVVQGIEYVFVENGAGIIGNDDANWLNGTGDFANSFEGGLGNDTVKGGGGDDTLRGGIGVDSVSGGDGSDTLYDGNDTAGNDTIKGGAGDDTLVKESSTASWALKDWQGGDDIDTFDWNTIELIDSRWVVNLAAGQIVFEGDARDLLSGIENVIVRNGAQIVGDGGANVLTAIGLFNNTINAGAGNDTINGGDGDDSLYGGGDSDSVYGGSGRDVLAGDDGDDYIFADTENDSLYGGIGADTLDGWSGDDLISGEAGEDSLWGYNGNDMIYGGQGTDTLLGEGGDDWMYLNAGEGWDNFYGGDDTDYVFFNVTAKLTIDMGSGTYTGGTSTSRGFDRIEYVSAGSGNDTVYASSNAETIYGNNGADVIYAGGGLDYAYGGLGNDTLSLSSNSGELYGDGGDDRLFVSDGALGSASFDGGAGNRDWLDLSLSTLNYYVDLTAGILTDLFFNWNALQIENIQGNGTNESLTGNSLNNQINGGSGDDTLYGLFGLDTLSGGAGNDLIDGGASNDRLAGGGGNDQLYGGTNNDTLIGENNDDLLFGGGGNDSLDGGAQRDTLNGGAGTDTLIGGTWADTFVFGSASEIGNGATSDQIVDFLSGLDKIDLSAIAGLSYIGTSGFSNVAGQLRHYTLGGVTYLAGDLNGNSVAEFEVVLLNGTSLAAGDLILV